MDDAILKPVRGKRTPRLGPVAIMAATLPDLKLLCELSGLDSGQRHPLYISELILPRDPGADVAVAGPVVGAPYAAMILETLISWGACEVIFYGWCGALTPRVAIGDIIIPQAAVMDEGTSRHYLQQESERTHFCGPREKFVTSDAFSFPSSYLNRHLVKTAEEKGCEALQGPVWSTDGIYRETPEKVRHYRKMSCLAVEMELSALFSVAAYREVKLAGVLVVSDDLSCLSWKPGFREPAFKQGRQTACDLVAGLAAGRASALQRK